MKSPLVTVPRRELEDLALAVERLDRLSAEGHEHPDLIDPTSLFDAMSEVYAASRSLIRHPAMVPCCAASQDLTRDRHGVPAPRQ